MVLFFDAWKQELPIKPHRFLNNSHKKGISRKTQRTKPFYHACQLKKRKSKKYRIWFLRYHIILRICSGRTYHPCTTFFSIPVHPTFFYKKKSEFFIIYNKYRKYTMVRNRLYSRTCFFFNSISSTVRSLLGN